MTVLAAICLRPRNVPEPGTGGALERRIAAVISIVELYRSTTGVGREHIASAVNTVALAYTAALLLVHPLIVGSGQAAVSATLPGEFITQETVRSATATVGLIAAVPITMVLAAVTAGPAARRGHGAARRLRANRSDTLTALAGRPGHGAWE